MSIAFIALSALVTLGAADLTIPSHAEDSIPQLSITVAPRPADSIPQAPLETLPLSVDTLPHPSIPAEARALWVTRFDYDSEAAIGRIMETAARAHFNIIYFQARGAGDAYYRSSIEPCAALLCGKLGGTPPYDPLEVAVREGHRRGLEVHAYLNALTGRPAGIDGRCKSIPEPDAGNPRHMLLDHPEWVMSDRTGKRLPCPNSEEYLWVSPSYPEVRTRLATVAADIARRYDVDGIHLDRIRYPGNAWSYDAASRAGFGRNPDLYPADWKAYRTGLVNSMVRETYDSIAAVRPALVLSAAVWGVYDDIWNWKTLGGHTDLMQDSRAWAKQGYMDILVPMTYSRIKVPYCSRIDWGCMLDEQLEGAERETGRQMYIGIDASKGAREIVEQIRLARSRGVTGMAIFSFTDANKARVWPMLEAGVFASPAVVPAMPWKRAGTH
ncbi:MAG TPA: family 10 glycosylhydrolase [Gemmatimonadaceae bacterium]|nr:family 10 glycosylhydrolase [Gemmatimonadaceae bacterium]